MIPQRGLLFATYVIIVSLIAATCSLNGSNDSFANPVGQQRLLKIGTNSSDDEEALFQSLKHYVMALDAYNSGNLGKANGQLQAAASNAKHADPELARILTFTSDRLREAGMIPIPIAVQVASIYNHYIAENNWNYPQFDLENPTTPQRRWAQQAEA